MEQSKTTSDSKKAFEGIQSLSYSRTTAIVASPSAGVELIKPVVILNRRTYTDTRI
jgi:hypothetical protein